MSKGHINTVAWNTGLAFFIFCEAHLKDFT